MEDETKTEPNRMQHLEAEMKRLTRERAALMTKNEELEKKLRVAEGDRDRAKALLSMAMDWRGQVITKIDEFEETLAQFSAKLEGIVEPPRSGKKR